MSRLVLIRHGQASFFAKDYDQLSGPGAEQSRRLARYWLRQGIQFDEVIVGPRKRHRQTADLIEECFSKEGRSWPKALEMPEFDEHQVDRFVVDAKDQLAGHSPELGQLLMQWEKAESKEDQQRSFQKLFQVVASLWSEGRITNENIESWREFRHRVLAGIDRIVDQQGRGRHVAVFTSVGVITAVLQRALDCPNLTAFELGWRVRNCSLTEFLFSGEKFTLEHFNTLCHLEDHSLWTYR